MKKIYDVKLYGNEIAMLVSALENYRFNIFDVNKNKKILDLQNKLLKS